MNGLRVRIERVALQVQKEISDIIRMQVKDPHVGFVTVTGCEVSNDMTHAKVFVSVLGSSEQRTETMGALERAKGFIRSELGRRIRLRVTPELHFKLDESVDYSIRIGHMLGEITSQESPSDIEKQEIRADE